MESLSTAETLVLRWLNRHADSDGVGYLALADLSRFTNLNKAHLLSVLKLLEKRGAIQRKAVYKDGILCSNYYQLVAESE